MGHSSKRNGFAKLNRKHNRTTSRPAGFEGLESRVLFSAINLTVSTQFPFITNSPTPTITGTASHPAADVSVTFAQEGGAQQTFPANADGNGNWSVTAGATLPDGHYDITVDATDNGGADTGEAVFNNDLIVDTINPAVSFDAGQLPAKTRTDLVLTGTFTDANIDTIAVTLDDGNGHTSNFAATIDGNAGTWSAPVSINGIADGAYSVSVAATDLAGNVTPAAGGTLTIDTSEHVTANNVTTNSSMASLTGTVDTADLATLQVTVNSATYSVANGDITVNGGGSWTLPLPSTADGTYAVHAVATDDVGNSATADSQLLIDTTVPTVTLDNGQLPAITKVDTTLTGTFDDINIQSITVTLDDGHGGTFDFPANIDNNAETWSATIPIAGVPDGQYSVNVAALDAAGNSGNVPSNNSLTIDTTAPVVAIDGGQLPASFNSTTTLTGTFTDANIDTITVTLDDGNGDVLNFNAAVNAAGGTWSATIDGSGAPDGAYAVSVTATDLAGNSTTINAADPLTIDTVEHVTVNSQNSKQSISTVTGTVDAADLASLEVTVNQVTYSVGNGDITVDGGGNWSLTLPSLTDGSYAVHAVATDSTGNVATADGQLLIDTVAPSVTIGNGQLPAFANSDVTLTGTFADANITSIVVLVDDGNGHTAQFNAAIDSNSGTWSAPIPIAGLIDAGYTVSVTATDIANNSTVVTSPNLLTVDTAAPSVAIDNGQLPAKTRTDIALTGTFTDANIGSIVVSIDDGNGDVVHFNASVDSNAGTWSATVLIAGVPDAQYNVSVKATDLAGNSTTIAAGNLTIDTIEHVMVNDLNSNSSTPTLTGTIDPADVGTLEVMVNSTTYTFANGDITIDGGGNWSLALPMTNDGTYSIHAVATDNIGNVATADGTLIVDTVAPAVTFDGTLPAKTRSDFTVSGTYTDANITGIVITLDDGHGHMSNFNAVLDTNAQTWSALISIGSLPDATYAVSVTATDVANNADTINPGSITVDTVVHVSANNLTSNISTNTVTGTVDTSDLATLEVTVNSVTYTFADGDISIDGGGNWSLDLPSLPDANYPITAVATDDIGNVATANATLLVDTTAPQVTLDNGTTSRVVRGSTILSGTYDDANIIAISVTLNDGHGGVFNHLANIHGDGTWSVAVSAFGAADGVYNVSVTATDVAINSTTINPTGLLTVDQTAPTVSADNSPLTILTKTNRTLTGTYVDANIASISVTLDNGHGGVFTFPATLDTNAQTWSAPISIAGVPDGVYSVSVTATDLAANATSISAGTFAIDVTAPVVALDSGELPAFVNTSTTLTGTFTDPDISTISVKLDDGHGGVFSFPATLDTNAGTWSAPISIAGVADGLYTVSVTATDSLNNTTTISPGFFTVDTTAPVIAFDNGQLPAFIHTGTTLTGTYTDANIDTIVVKLDDGNSHVFLFGATIDTAHSTWSAAIAINSIPDGVYTVSITTADLAHNTTTVTGGNLTVDTVAPAVIIDNGQLPTVTKTTTTLTGTFADTNMSGIVVTLDDGQGHHSNFTATLNTGAGTWSVPISITGLPDGAYTVTVTATDLANNSTTISPGTLTIDTTAPTVALNTGQLPTFVHTATSLSGTVSDPNIQTVTVTLTDGANSHFVFPATINAGTWTAPIAITGLGDGPYTVSITAADGVGNLTTISPTGAITVDTTAPTVSFTAGQLPRVTRTAVTLTGNFSDTNISTVVVTLTNTTGSHFTFNATLNSGAGTWAAPVSISGLAEGAYTVSVTATDLAGNTTTATGAGALTVDVTAPAVAFDAGQLPTKINADKVLTGTFVDANISAISITVTDGNGHNATFPATINSVAGTWSTTVAIAGLPDGAYTVSATATDQSGNSTTASAAGSLIIHAAAPIVTVTTVNSRLSSPAINGTIDDPSDTVVVTIGGANYTATTSGTAWSIAAGAIAALPDGNTTFTVTATDTLGHATVLSNRQILIDTTAPTVAANFLLTATTSPALTGTVNDSTASISVNVNGTNYTAVNNHNGTWSLAAGTVTKLNSGAYDIAVTATDSLGNVGTSTFMRGLIVTNSQSLTLGSSITRVTYMYHGTRVTVTANSGAIRMTFSGINVQIFGSGSSRTIAGAGGILGVDIAVLANSRSLTIQTSGSAIAAVNSISGNGNLDSLIADTTDLLGPVQMSGSIQSLRVHSIQSNVTMGTTSPVSITAAIFKGATISVSDIQSLSASQSFQSTNVFTTLLGSVTLSNVTTGNGGVAFGIRAHKITSLKLKQGARTLSYRKDFTGGLGDFFVHLV